MGRKESIKLFFNLQFTWNIMSLPKYLHFNFNSIYDILVKITDILGILLWCFLKFILTIYIKHKLIQHRLNLIYRRKTIFLNFNMFLCACNDLLYLR